MRRNRRKTKGVGKKWRVLCTLLCLAGVTYYQYQDREGYAVAMGTMQYDNCILVSSPGECPNAYEDAYHKAIIAGTPLEVMLAKSAVVTAAAWLILGLALKAYRRKYRSNPYRNL